MKQIAKSIATKLGLISAIKTQRQNPSITCSWQSQGWLQPACFICLNTSFPCSQCKGIFPAHIPFNLLEWVLCKCLTFIYTEPWIPQPSEHTLIIGTGNRLGLSKGTGWVEICQAHISASHGGNTRCFCGRAWPHVILQLRVKPSMRRSCIPAGMCRVKKRCDKSLLLLQEAEKSHFRHCSKGKNVPFTSRGLGCKCTETGLTAPDPQVSPLSLSSKTSGISLVHAREPQTGCI